VHRDAHGIMASTVLELDSTEPLNRFFGATPAFAPGVAYEAPALRVIVFTDIRGSVAMTHEHGDEGHMHLLGEHDRLVRAELAANAGREVKHTGDGIMASFDSAVAAVAFAVTVQRRLEERNAAAAVPIHVGIGISAGEPVTNDVGDLFGAAVQLAARLCALAEPGEVTVSSAVRELCVGKKIDFVDRGAATIKGVPEPVVSFAVHWCA
jgi:class 3 adenylate cyclase